MTIPQPYRPDFLATLDDIEQSIQHLADEMQDRNAERLLLLHAAKRIRQALKLLHKVKWA